MSKAAVGKTNERERILERCLDDGGRQVDGLNEFATSGDQRGVTVASVYIGAATALVAGLIAWVASESQPPPRELVLSGLITAGLFYAGALICLWTAFPAPTFIAGNPPEFWRWHIENDSTYGKAIESQVAEYERKIKLNSAERSRVARLYKFGALLGAFAPIIGGGFYLTYPCWAY